MNKAYVFVDTNQYIDNTFNFAQWALSDLMTAAKEGEVAILNTEVVDREVREHIDLEVAEAWNALSKKHTIVFSSGISLGSKKELKARCIGNYEQFLKDSSAELIEASPEMCRATFQMYLDKTPLFKQKSSLQFKDAFSLAALVGYLEENGEIETIHVCTNDVAFREACKPFKGLVVFHSLKDFQTFIAKKKEELYTEYTNLARDYMEMCKIEFEDRIWDKVEDIAFDFGDGNIDLQNIIRREIVYTDFEITSISHEEVTAEIPFDFAADLELSSSIVVWDSVDREEVTIGRKTATHKLYQPGILTVKFLIEKDGNDTVLEVDDVEVTVPPDIEIGIDDHEWNDGSDDKE